MFRYQFSISFFLLCAMAGGVQAQRVDPTINPVMTIVTDDGEQEDTNYSGSAPIKAHFKAGTENQGDYDAFYEWTFYEPGRAPFLMRYDADTDYEFVKAGTTFISLKATFVLGSDTLEYETEEPFSVIAAESKLEVPNAFSPNGDGINDVFRVKDTYTSIIKFKASIFNRWGTKLFEWTDPAEGWDGTYKGKMVKDGVYFVLIEAEGADGVKYRVRKDVNVLTGFSESTTKQ